MPLTYSEEMLSAYLDGEATPEERALVERLLEEKPELQERLTALSDLSQSVQNLPRQTAPADFASSVLDEVNQRRPTPSQLQTKDAPASITPSKRTPRFWISSLVAMSVLVAVGVLLTTSRQQTTESDVAHLESASNKQVDHGDAGEVAFTAPPGMTSEMMLDEALPDTEMDDSLLSLGMPAEFLDGGLAGIKLATDSLNSAKIVTLNRKEIALRLSSLSESPELGDQLSILTKDNETPILVDFVVVDVQKSWNQLQVLLKQYSVEPVMVDSNGDKSSPKSSGEMISIYLDLDEPVLETVLGQVSALDAVVFLSDETQPIRNLGLAGAAEEKNDAKPQSLAFETPKNLQEEPKSQTSSSRLATKQDTSRFGRTHEQRFRFDIKEARLIQKTKISSNTSLPAYENSRMDRGGNGALADASNNLRKTFPPSPAKPERLLKSKDLSENPEAKRMAGRKPKTKLPTPALSATTGQSLPTTKPLGIAEAPSQKSARAAKKSTERVRALLIFRTKQE